MVPSHRAALHSNSMQQGGSQSPYELPPPPPPPSAAIYPFPVPAFSHHANWNDLASMAAAASLPGGNAEPGDHGAAPSFRWPRHETLELIRIRSEMDAAFRNSTAKGPLWEEISRRLSRQGIVRSAKKCREKFENLHKYHKRTKEGRAGRHYGKNYRFYSQLEALSNPPMGEKEPPPQHLSSNSSSDFESDSDDEEEAAPPGGKRKKSGCGQKTMAFLDELMRKVVQQQEHMQQRFLREIERREHERALREEAWKARDIARISREIEMIEQERADVAARDAALMSLLYKITGEPVLPTTSSSPPDATSSRWPKAEVHALIRVRSGLDSRYHDAGQKGPLWEDVSGEMKKLGYERSAKRCKEKWENINKYFKKVKDGNKKRGEDSKTCPYFHLLEALYRGEPVGGPAPEMEDDDFPPPYFFDSAAGTVPLKKPEEILQELMMGHGDEEEDPNKRASGYVADHHGRPDPGSSVSNGFNRILLPRALS